MKKTVYLIALIMIGNQGCENSDNLVKVGPNSKLTTPSYFLSPTNRHEMVFKTNIDGLDYNSNASVALENLLDTNMIHMALDLYSNESYKLVDNNSGGWSTRFHSSLSKSINYATAKTKSALYANPKDACESGWSDISVDMIGDRFATSSAKFNSSNGLCNIVKNGKTVLSMMIWTTSGRGDFTNNIVLHIGDGSSLIFVKTVGNAFRSDDGSTLTKDEKAGTWTFTDSLGATQTYSNEGRLISLYQGTKALSLEYDGQLLTAVVDKFGKRLDFSYDKDGHLNSVVDALNDKSVFLEYDNDTLSLVKQINSSSTTATYEVDYENKLLTHVSMNDKLVAAYLYDPNGNINSYTSTRGTTDINYDQRSIHLTDDSGETTVYYDYINGKRVVTSYDSNGETSSLSYSAEGRITKLSKSNKPTNTSSTTGISAPKTSTTRLELFLDWDPMGKLTKAKMSKDGNTSENKYQYNKQGRTTKSLVSGKLVVNTYDEKGKRVKRTVVKGKNEARLNLLFESSDMDSVLLPGDDNYETRIYTYQKNGLLEHIEIDGSGISKIEYDEYGRVVATVKPNGERVEKQFSIAPKMRQKLQSRGTAGGTYYWARSSSDTQVAWVGGAGDDWISRITKDYEEEWDKYNSNSVWYSYEDVGSTFGAPLTYWCDPFNKNKAKLIVVGHSWGGDSAVEASKQTCNGNDVNLLVTIDPIGTGDWNDGASYWIEVYANPGSIWSWSSGDWIAYIGGKYSFSTYDEGNAYPNKFLKYSASHEDFAYMIGKMERDSRYSFDFGLRK